MKTRMKDWIDMGSDVNWETYGGKWAYPDPVEALRWYVLDFVDMDEACGRDNLGQPRYICEVNLVDIKAISPEEMARAVGSCGPGMEELEGMETPERCFALMIAAHDYGIKALLRSVSGNRAAWVRASARRAAEELMGGEERLAEALGRKVNQIGSTAADFLCGDISAGLRRAAEEVASGAREPTVQESILMKMHAACGGNTLGGKTRESVALSSACAEALAKKQG